MKTEITYEIGKIYKFEVNANQPNLREYIALNDGYKDTYRVQPYEYQSDWDKLPDVMECVVTNLNVFGLPTLRQIKLNALKECYGNLDDNNVFTFTVVSHNTDSNTNRPYYMLKDVFGIYHRYYYSRKEQYQYQDGDNVDLCVSQICEVEGKESYLKMGPVGKPSKVADEILKTEVDEQKSLGMENEVREFKKSIVFTPQKTDPDIEAQLKVIHQTIAALQNAKGGELYIGVNDGGWPCGISHDMPYLNSGEPEFEYKNTLDSYELRIRNNIIKHLGKIANSNITFKFEPMNNGDYYCVINVAKAIVPIWVDQTYLFQRAGNMSQRLGGDMITTFYRRWLKDNEDADSVAHEVAVEPEPIKIENKKDSVAIVTPLSVAKGNIWKYVTMYNDGKWSMQDGPSPDGNVMMETPIYDTLKKEILLLCYENGRVNSVCPANIRPERLGYHYAGRDNGKLMYMKNVSKRDLIAFFSENKSTGEKHVKIHPANYLRTTKQVINNGSIVIHDKFNMGLKDVKVLGVEYFPNVCDLVEEHKEPSQTIGPAMDDTKYRDAIRNLNTLCLKTDLVK